MLNEKTSNTKGPTEQVKKQRLCFKNMLHWSLRFHSCYLYPQTYINDLHSFLTQPHMFWCYLTCWPHT